MFRGGLSSLTLVATATGLVVLVLLVDLYGSTRRDEPFWKCRRQCGYSTECAMRRKTLVRMLKNGETINLSELQERQGEAGGGKAGGGVGHQAFEVSFSVIHFFISWLSRKEERLVNSKYQTPIYLFFYFSSWTSSFYFGV